MRHPPCTRGRRAVARAQRISFEVEKFVSGSAARCRASERGWRSHIIRSVARRAVSTAAFIVNSDGGLAPALPSQNESGDHAMGVGGGDTGAW
jgi:hypothetical protein